MLKRTLWFVIAVLAAACTVYYANSAPVTAVPTSTPTVEIVTTTVEATQMFTATPTLVKTSTPITTSTPVITTSTSVATKTPTLAFTATPSATSFPYSVQTGSPVYMANFAHSDADCDWSGIAGQIFDASGNPITNDIVKVTGTYNGSTINQLAVTGTVSDNPYGPGSYEIVLGTTAVDSSNTLSIQAFDSSGNPISASVAFSTYSDCSKNLVILNFKAN